MARRRGARNPLARMSSGGWAGAGGGLGRSSALLPNARFLRRAFFRPPAQRRSRAKNFNMPPPGMSTRLAAKKKARTDSREFKTVAPPPRSGRPLAGTPELPELSPAAPLPSSTRHFEPGSAAHWLRMRQKKTGSPF